MKELIHLFRWQDGLDILILTFVFYRLYLWLKKKKALRMVLAMLALPFYYLVAQWVDLPLSVWGLQNLWAVILLVLVVIFQQEIREVLGSITLPMLLFGKTKGLPPKQADKIAEAAFKMAHRGIGGLIVLQRGDDLDEFIPEKTLLDAEISEDIFISIFNHQSPLHDGAVILWGDRIRYAGAVLPISQSSSFPKEWGTRHRAGLGITEVSDAESIIISEERQEVLLAARGSAEKHEDKEDLKKSLSNFPMSPLPVDKKDGKKREAETFLRSLPVKALFLFLVILLWAYVIAVRQGEISFNVPIEYYSIPRHLGIAGTPPKEINVRLRGSQRLLSGVNPGYLRVQVDLSKAHFGTNQVSLTEANLNAPSGVSVTSLYPGKITLQLTQAPQVPK
jgi:diadenylate cyclase